MKLKVIEHLNVIEPGNNNTHKNICPHSLVNYIFIYETSPLRLILAVKSIL